jgi:RimJ/RimL family protein N-acetyltransferase
MLILETDRLNLSELSPADDEFIVALLNSPGFLAHIGDRGVRTGEDARRYLAEGPLASYAAHGFGLWKVTRRSDGLAVGMSGLIKRDVLAFPDLGYAFLPGHAGRGYATEAGAAVLALGFGPRGLARVLAIVQAGNDGSVRVLEKLGMTDRGVGQFDHQVLRVFGKDAPEAT